MKKKHLSSRNTKINIKNYSKNNSEKKTNHKNTAKTRNIIINDENTPSFLQNIWINTKNIKNIKKMKEPKEY